MTTNAAGEIKQFSRIEQERDAQLAKADARIEQARKTGQELEKRQAERESVVSAYAALLEKQSDRVMQARVRDQETAANQAKAEAANAAQAKDKARLVFIKAGGLAADFEAAWPGILQNTTLRNMQKTDRAADKRRVAY